MFDMLKMFLVLMALILIVSFITGLIAFALDLIRYKSTFDGAMKRDDLLERLMFKDDIPAQEQPEPEEVSRKEFEIDVG